jgi:hypothetical protein
MVHAYDSAVTSSPSSMGTRRASGNPFTRGPSTSTSNVTLSCHDIGELFISIIVIIFMVVSLVPIYDARKVDSNFYDLASDPGRLERVNREVPFGSCAVVAYTLNTWGKSDPINVSFNVKWVMVLGVPSKA